MLIRIIGIIALLLLSIGSANAACGPDTPPALAAAAGLTCEVFVDNWIVNQNTNSIDTANTLVPASCPSATFPNGVCHWYVNNAWPQSTIPTFCPDVGGVCNQSKLPTVVADYSVSSSGLLLHPQQFTVTGNTVNGSNQLTNISVTTGVQTQGSAVVAGPGVPGGTWFTLSGTTATMSNNATSTNTGSTYVIGNMHNGWMMQTCGYSASAPGYVGTAFTGNMYVEITVPTNPTPGPNWTGIESEPEGWTWPLELLAGTRPTGSNLLNIMEDDFFDWNGGTGGQRTIYNESINAAGSLSFIFGSTFGGPYYSYDPGNIGGSPYGQLILDPSTNAGGPGIGQVVNVASGGPYSTLNYGPSIQPYITGQSPYAQVGSFTQLPQLHYCLMLDAAPDFPMTVTKVAVWQAPPPTAGGGRKGLFR